MSGYTQLPREKRYQIHVLMKTQQNQTPMATVGDGHKSTISRELRRNRGLRGYRPHQAHRLAHARQMSKQGRRFSPPAWRKVEGLGRPAWSPEHISSRMQREHGTSIRLEWIYQ
jgi:transposase, IS30 family